MQLIPVVTPGSVEVLPHVERIVLGTIGVLPATAAEIVRRVRQRSDIGLERYGSRLMTFNGRDAGLDAEEEALDLLQYTVQNYLEGRYTARLVQSVVWLVADVITARPACP